MKLTPEFKKAISELPNEEKDKLIFRLIKKDPDLANRIYFELIDTDSVEEKRLIIENELVKYIKLQAKRYYSPGYVLMETRFASGKISDHVKITKDKYGEPYLNLLMLIQTLKENQQNLKLSTYGACYTLNIYIVARVYKILTQIQSLHQDFHLEFRESLEKLGELIVDFPYLMKVAINNQLDVNWLFSGEIPKDIIARQKELRTNGFLK
jgi:hypothetical protein